MEYFKRGIYWTCQNITCTTAASQMDCGRFWWSQDLAYYLTHTYTHTQLNFMRLSRSEDHSSSLHPEILPWGLGRCRIICLVKYWHKLWLFVRQDNMICFCSENDKKNKQHQCWLWSSFFFFLFFFSVWWSEAAEGAALNWRTGMCHQLLLSYSRLMLQSETFSSSVRGVGHGHRNTTAGIR